MPWHKERMQYGKRDPKRMVVVLTEGVLDIIGAYYMIRYRGGGGTEGNNNYEKCLHTSSK